ncbi:MAG: hydrolase [Leptothrix sp. (in: Bacteria)]|nr:hydrolase [Leptothrix sp. (in: b-proteobacteria)]
MNFEAKSPAVAGHLQAAETRAAAARIGHMEGDLALPARPLGLVLFAHGSDSSRFSPRNRSVAQVLNAHRLGSLLFDLLDEDEARDRRRVFDIALLGSRLTEAIDWARAQPALAGLPIGLFGASTGAAAALVAAARRPDVRAVVSRGGRPDLALPELREVQAPTLLIVGGEDPVVLGLNRGAARLLGCPHRLEIVPGATHLFEEPGALGRVAELAAGWFEVHLGGAPAADDERRPT